MSEQEKSKDKAEIFKLFEISLSNDQRHILLKHPDILSPELISQLYQASLERMSAQHIGPTFPRENVAIDDGGEATSKKPRKMVNSWMAFRCRWPLLCDTDHLRLTIRSVLLTSNQRLASESPIANVSITLEKRC